MKQFKQMIKDYMYKNFGTGLMYVENGGFKTVDEEVQFMIVNLEEGYIDSYYLKDEKAFIQWLDEWTAFFCVYNPVIM